ncbi:hypothetical protein ACFQL7_20790 [Halocatena marina]|uniref:Uncharacterized protein n=1 Tax=Halocatena marina TaxID=2934937 RepID=A0ABD5YV17_9EURY|nr:hypothetical protein [Halocatena marina]
MFDALLTQIAQTPSSTSFLLGFFMAAALRRGRFESMMDAVFDRLVGKVEPVSDGEDGEKTMLPSKGR